MKLFRNGPRAHWQKLGILVALGALVTASPALADPVHGGTLTWAYERETATIVPINVTGLAQHVGPKIFDGLLTYDEGLVPIPQLAESWDVSPDGLTYTFHIREGVLWHDGESLTAEDVAFSFARLKEAHPRGRVTFATVTDIETPDGPDGLVVVLRLSSPTPYLLSALASSESPIVPRHIYEALDPNAPTPDAAAIGSGPFVLREWVRGSHILFERNPDYWDEGKPYLDQLIVRIVPDAAARSAGLEAGELDISPVAASDVARLQAVEGLIVEDRPSAYGGRHHQIVFNFENEILADVQVRRAIARAIDLDAIQQVIFFGYGRISPTPISPSLGAFHNPEITGYEFDPDEANRLLDEAGYDRGPDGTRFSVRLVSNPANDPRLASLLQQWLQAIGIRAEIGLQDHAAYISRVYNDRDFDLAIEALANTFDPTVGVQRVYWSGAFEVGVAFSNPGNYSNPEVDRVLEAAAVEPDPETRIALFHEFQNLVHEDVPVIDFIDPPDFVGSRVGVEGFAFGALGLSGNFANAYVIED